MKFMKRLISEAVLLAQASGYVDPHLVVQEIGGFTSWRPLGCRRETLTELYLQRLAKRCWYESYRSVSLVKEALL
jgi:hypothetical protein